MLSTLFTNARLISYPSEQTFNVLISKSTGSIESITPTSPTSSKPLASSNAEDETIDLEGKSWIGPSLKDSHVHFTAWSLQRARFDLSSAKCVKDVVRIVREEASKGKEKKVLIGRGFRVGSWPDIDNMTMNTLDQAEKDIPVILISGDLHSSWYNTAGLHYVGRDSTQETGVLFEKDSFNALNQINDLPDDELDPIIEDAARAAAARGVTEIVELEMTHNIANWKRRIGKGIDQLRVHAGMYDEHIHDAIDVGLKSGDMIEETQGLLRVGPYKVITDGSLGARTAYCCDPYPGTTNNYGLWIYPTPTLKQMLEYGTKHSLTLAIHAIGDKANALCLEAFSKLSPSALHGSSIEHAQLISERDFELFGSIKGLIASIQPEHLLDDKELAERFWPRSTCRAFAYKSLVDAGVPIRLGSDAPVADLEPWGAIAAAVWRERRGEQGNSWHSEQCLDLSTAWKASTWNQKEGIEAGMVADLIVVGQDPLKVKSAKEMREIGIKGTMLGGRWTHRNGI